MEDNRENCEEKQREEEVLQEIVEEIKEKYWAIKDRILKKYGKNLYEGNNELQLSFAQISQNFKSKACPVLKGFQSILSKNSRFHDFAETLEKKSISQLIIKIIQHLSNTFNEPWVQSIKLFQEFFLSELEPIEKPLPPSDQKFKKFTNFLCQVCYTYACLVHPKSKSKNPSIQVYNDLAPLAVNSSDWKAKYLYNYYTSGKSWRWAKSYKCSACQSTGPSRLTRTQRSLIKRTSISNPCIISLLFNLPCASVRHIPGKISIKYDLPPVRCTFPIELPYPNSSPNCKCDVCDSSCPCLNGLSQLNHKSYQSRGYCERFCKCSFLCPYKFFGCDCHDLCASKACVCFKNQIECDPFLCRGCKSAQEVIFGRESCGNVRTQGGKGKKRLVIGKSGIEGAGLGVFAEEKIGDGEVIGEYTGEIVTDREADRRGKLYDVKEHSFLFNLDCMNSLDATYFGSILKYANHKDDKMANCYSQIWRVLGECKVLILAKSSIEIGEELFFDYKYQMDVTYEWYYNYKKSLS